MAYELCPLCAGKGHLWAPSSLASAQRCPQCDGTGVKPQPRDSVATAYDAELGQLASGNDTPDPNARRQLTLQDIATHRAHLNRLRLEQENGLEQENAIDGMVDANEKTTATKDFQFADFVNGHRWENISNTPDFVLGRFLATVFEAFNDAVRNRDQWYGIAPDPGKSYGISDEDLREVVLTAIKESTIIPLYAAAGNAVMRIKALLSGVS